MLLREIQNCCVSEKRSISERRVPPVRVPWRVPEIKNSDEAACFHEIGSFERQAEKAATLETEDL